MKHFSWDELKASAKFDTE